MLTHMGSLAPLCLLLLVHTFSSLGWAYPGLGALGLRRSFDRRCSAPGGIRTLVDSYLSSYFHSTLLGILAGSARLGTLSPVRPVSLWPRRAALAPPRRSAYKTFRSVARSLRARCHRGTTPTTLPTLPLHFLFISYCTHFFFITFLAMATFFPTTTYEHAWLVHSFV